MGFALRNKWLRGLGAFAEADALARFLPQDGSKDDHILAVPRMLYPAVP